MLNHGGQVGACAMLGLSTWLDCEMVASVDYHHWKMGNGAGYNAGALFGLMAFVFLMPWCVMGIFVFSLQVYKTKGPSITNYKSNWRSIWIRDVFCYRIPAP